MRETTDSMELADMFDCAGEFLVSPEQLTEEELLLMLLEARSIKVNELHRGTKE